MIPKQKANSLIRKFGTTDPFKIAENLDYIVVELPLKGVRGFHQYISATISSILMIPSVRKTGVGCAPTNWDTSSCTLTSTSCLWQTTPIMYNQSMSRRRISLLLVSATLLMYWQRSMMDALPLR